MIKNDDGKFEITLNPSSWNIEAHLIVLDQPAGVGFSVKNPNVNISNT